MRKWSGRNRVWYGYGYDLHLSCSKGYENGWGIIERDNEALRTWPELDWGILLLAELGHQDAWKPFNLEVNKVYIEKLDNQTKWDAIGEVEKVGGKEVDEVDHLPLLDIWAGCWQVVERLVLGGVSNTISFIDEVTSPSSPFSGHTHLSVLLYTVMNDSISFVVR